MHHCEASSSQLCLTCLHYFFCFRAEQSNRQPLFDSRPCDVKLKEIIESRPPLRTDLTTPGPWAYSPHTTKPLNETNAPSYTMRPKCWAEKGMCTTSHRPCRRTDVVQCVCFVCIPSLWMRHQGVLWLLHMTCIFVTQHLWILMIRLV